MYAVCIIMSDFAKSDPEWERTTVNRLVHSPQTINSPIGLMGPAGTFVED